MDKVKGRSYKVVLTNEARVLKDLRVKHKLSMREAGARVGVSDSYVSLIENGRTDPPQGESLGRFLKIYGGISEKYFYELVRNHKAELTDEQILVELVSKLSSADQKLLRVIAEELAKRG
jgi:transcriptional regulator with XRE-family HTH domain